MVVTGRDRPLPYRIPDVVSREQLLVWCRMMAPDLRIRVQRLDDGRRACTADFTLGSEELNAQAVESDSLPDPDDAIVRRCAWLIRRRMGIHTRLDDTERRALERDIIAASLRGDADLADKLGLQLANMNEGLPAAQPVVRTQFESHGGSMFDERRG